MSNTPARRTRNSSATPLPPLQAQQNHSYGVSGKVSLLSQMATNKTNLASVMATRSTRSTAGSATPSAQPVEEETIEQYSPDESQEPAPTPKPITRRRTTRLASTAPSEVVEERPAARRRSRRQPSAVPTEIAEEESRTATFLGNLPGEILQGAGLTEPTGAKEQERLAEEAKAAEESKAHQKITQETQEARASSSARRSASARKPATSSSKALSSRSSGVHDDQDEHEPNFVSVFFRTLPRYLPQIFRDANADLKDHYRNRPSLTPLGRVLTLLGWLFLLMLSLAALLSATYAAASLLPWSGTMQNWAEQYVVGSKRLFGVSPYDRPMSDLETQWNQFKHDRILADMLPTHNVAENQWQLNINFLDRIVRMEGQIEALQNTVGLHNDTLHMIKELLPRTIAVREIDNHWEIPDIFWEGLRQRLTTDEKAISPLWDNFIALNEHKLSLMSRQVISEEIQSAMSSQHIISKDMFVEAVEQNYAMIQERYGEELHAVEKKLLTEARAQAVTTSRDILDKSPLARFAKLQTDSLAYSNVIANTKAAMMAVNHFAIGFGTRVDPRLTSPTYHVNKGWLAKAYMWWDGQAGPNPPIEALRKWDEATECWCATPSTDANMGKAQLGIMMSQKIFPDRVIVEHMPHTGTFQIAAAPRMMELWAETRSAEEAIKVQRVIDETVPPSEYRDCTKAPSPKHVCIAKWRYDIHYDNWVQSASMFVDTEALGLGVDKVVVKAVSNWGSGITCLYRVRLTGKRVVILPPGKDGI